MTDDEIQQHVEDALDWADPGVDGRRTRQDTAQGSVRANMASLVLVISLLLATASAARAEIGVIVLEPVSALGFFTRVGHAGTYLSNICPDGSPIRMRLCRPGESGGVVIGRPRSARTRTTTGRSCRSRNTCTASDRPISRR